MAKVSLENLTVSYNRHPALHHITGSFESGSLTAITGPNGAGKSTLLKSIAGLKKNESGKIDLGVKRNELAYLPQAAEINHDFPLTILQLVCTGFWSQVKHSRRITKQMVEKVQEALAIVGLKGFEKRSISSLSAGQFQRALFARIIVQDAKLILLDEPFSAIDEDTTQRLLKIISQWHNEKRTVICVLHDMLQIKQHFPQCLLLARKCVAWGDTQTTLDPKNLTDSRFFHAAWNDTAEVCER